MGVQDLKTIIFFAEKEKLLHIDTRGLGSDAIDITVLNSLAETTHKMRLISGMHTISLASLHNGSYSVRLVAGNNVWVNKIYIHH